MLKNQDLKILASDWSNILNFEISAPDWTEFRISEILAFDREKFRNSGLWLVRILILENLGFWLVEKSVKRIPLGTASHVRNKLVSVTESSVTVIAFGSFSVVAYIELLAAAVASSWKNSHFIWNIFLGFDHVIDLFIQRWRQWIDQLRNWSLISSILIGQNIDKNIIELWLVEILKFRNPDHWLAEIPKFRNPGLWLAKFLSFEMLASDWSKYQITNENK